MKTKYLWIELWKTGHLTATAQFDRSVLRVSENLFAEVGIKTIHIVEKALEHVLVLKIFKQVIVRDES